MNKPILQQRLFALLGLIVAAMFMFLVTRPMIQNSLNIGRSGQNLPGSVQWTSLRERRQLLASSFRTYQAVIFLQLD